MLKTLSQIQVDPATELRFEKGHLGMTITSLSRGQAMYTILVQDEALSAQMENYQQVFGSISNIEVEVEHETETGVIYMRPMPVGAFTTATLILFPQRAWVKRFF